MIVLGGAAAGAVAAPMVVGAVRRHLWPAMPVKYNPLFNIAAGGVLAYIAGMVKPLRKFSTSLLLGPAIVELATLVKGQLASMGYGDYVALPYNGMGDYMALPWHPGMSGYGDQAAIEAGDLGYGDQYMIEQGELGGMDANQFFREHRTF